MPARAVAASFTEKQGWLAHRAHLLGFWERDNGACACQRPALSGCSNPPPGGSGDKMLDGDRVCAATQSLEAAGGRAGAAGAVRA
jgi:hypothetical protein